MAKVDIFSGFLGAGKTTLIKKLIAESFSGEMIVVIENEFGDIGIDGGFLKDAGIQITEMNSGCICCSLVGDFGKALGQVVTEYHPERIIIEPSGVGKLSDVIKAVENLHDSELELNSFTTVVDAKKCKMYMKNFGEFFNNQIESANAIILSHTGGLDDSKIQEVVDLIKEHNDKAEIVTTDWDKISGDQIVSSIEHSSTIKDFLKDLLEEEDICPVCGHHHDDDDDEHEHHHHHHDDEDDEHEHHHHHHDEDDDEHEHHHHHHDEDDDEHEHHHHHHDDDEEHGHHHHHHADEIFSSWGVESALTFTEESIREKLECLEDKDKYGTVLRAKGIVSGGDFWIHFDYTPGEIDVRKGSAEVIGRLCVIGSEINEKALSELFLGK